MRVQQVLYYIETGCWSRDLGCAQSMFTSTFALRMPACAV
jgi:hypothetical protein